LAVAEPARGRGLAAALLRRAGQVYQQLGFLLTYGSFDIARDLAGFYTRQGFTVAAPGEVLSMERLGLPFRAHAGTEEQLFYRWNAPH
jgi:GNAT superfamily N-acetyltransferase